MWVKILAIALVPGLLSRPKVRGSEGLLLNGAAQGGFNGGRSDVPASSDAELSAEKKSKLIYHLNNEGESKKRGKPASAKDSKSSQQGPDAANDQHGGMKHRQHVVLTSGSFESSQTQFYLDDGHSSYPTGREVVQSYQELAREFDLPFSAEEGGSSLENNYDWREQDGKPDQGSLIYLDLFNPKDGKAEVNSEE